MATTIAAGLQAAVVPLVTGLAIYALAWRLLRRGDMAVGTLVAYGLLGNCGSLDYTRWGGLPNALGFALLLVFLLIFFAPGLITSSLYRSLRAWSLGPGAT